MKIDLTGRTALVTGASRGIGEAIALRLAETGAHVLCAARNLEHVERVAGDITTAAATPRAVQLDITSADVRERIKALIEQQPIDILVNNAGITDDDLFIRMKPEAWTSVLRTNLDSAFHITQEVVKKMIRARWGRVINISSIVGLIRQSRPGELRGVEGRADRLHEVAGAGDRLAQRDGERHRARLHPHRDDRRDDRRSARRPSKTASPSTASARPTTSRTPSAFLASEQAGYITGTVLNVSGGLYT